MFEQPEGLVVPSFQTFLLIETSPCSSIQPCLLQEWSSSKPCSFSVASKSKNYLICTSQLSSIFTVRSLHPLISFIFLQADIPLPQSHLECEFYKVRSWISAAMSSVFRRYCPLHSGSAVSSSFQCQTVLCRIFFLLFFKQQELIFPPGFVFSCFLQVLVRGCFLPFTVPIHKIP